MKEGSQMKDLGKVFVDIDGTINAFKTVDCRIIVELFGHHRQVLFCDRILWKINDLDLISNSMRIFKLRILIYSILSFSSFLENMKSYERLYHAYTIKEVEENYRLHLKRLEELGYQVLLVTHSEFASIFHTKFSIEIPKKKPKFIKESYKKEKVSYMIGNNYCDDLKLPVKLGIKTIYIGKSRLVKHFIQKKAVVMENIADAVDYIIQNLN